MLTARLHILLTFVVTYQAEHGGVSPSFDEIMAGMGIGSRSTVLFGLRRLQERGFVRMMKNRARCIEVLKGPEAPEPMIVSSAPRPARRPPSGRAVFIPVVDGVVDTAHATEIPWRPHG